MRIVITEFISLDGVVQAPGGPEEDTDGGFAHGGWSHPFFDEAVGGGFDDALSNADALLFGRRTWQSMAAAWPERAGDPFADRMNAIPKYVVSATLGDDELTWDNTSRIPGDQAVDRIRELRETRGRRSRGDGEPHARANAHRRGTRGRAPAHDRAGAPWRRQDDLPRRRRSAYARAGLDGHERHGRARRHVPAGERGLAAG